MGRYAFLVGLSHPLSFISLLGAQLSQAPVELVEARVAFAAPLEAGALVEARPRLRARWTNRMILELVLVMCAFIGPGFARQFFASGRQAPIVGRDAPSNSLHGQLRSTGSLVRSCGGRDQPEGLSCGR